MLLIRLNIFWSVNRTATAAFQRSDLLKLALPKTQDMLGNGKIVATR